MMLQTLIHLMETNGYDCGYPQRNQAFETINAIKYSMPVPSDTSAFIHKIAPKKSECWGEIAANLKKNDAALHRRLGTGVDITMEFDDADKGAAALVQKCLSSSNQALETPHELNSTVNYISSILSLFQSHISARENVRCKVRITSSLGSVGTKCPRWHLDYVPLRLILSLTGPGCEYIPFEHEKLYPDGVNRNALNNGLDEADTAEANSMIIPGETNNNLVVHAKDGEAVLLMGRVWSSSRLMSGVPAAPHRSPSIFDEDLLRVVMVVDAVPSM